MEILMRCQWAVFLIAACGSSASMPDGSTTGDGPKSDARGDGSNGADGTPMRLPCTTQFGNAMSTAFGRLDGILVAIVPPGTSGCHGDARHIHLQVKANGGVYDIAVNVGSGTMQDVHSTTRDIQLPGAAWSEGWHPGFTDDYLALGVHAADLPLRTASQLISEVTSDLATANHISVFATGYSASGGHLIHYKGSGNDGLVVTNPLASTTHVRLFSFSNQNF